MLKFFGNGENLNIMAKMLMNFKFPSVKVDESKLNSLCNALLPLKTS